MAADMLPVMVVPIVAPNSGTKKSPYILDESIPRTRPPREVIREQIHQRDLERAKNKPDEERNFFDYMLLAQEKIEEMQKSTIKYYA